MLDACMQSESVPVCLVRHVNYYFNSNNSNGRSSAERELCSQSLRVYLQPERFAFQNAVVKLHRTEEDCWNLFGRTRSGAEKLKKVTCEKRKKKILFIRWRFAFLIVMSTFLMAFWSPTSSPLVGDRTGSISNLLPNRMIFKSPFKQQNSQINYRALSWTCLKL